MNRRPPIAKADLARMQATRQRRRDRANELCRDYHRRRRRQTPAWADRKAIQAVYAEARRRSDVENVAYDVDHVFPLNSDWVSGLHVAENLAIVPMGENRSKGNRPSNVTVVGVQDDAAD